MSRATTDLISLHTRFASRANMALDTAGYPMGGRERANLLATALGEDADTCRSLLQGLEMPDWGFLLKFCQLTGRQLGWFFDTTVPELPDGTYLVKPLTIGETLVIRLPGVILHASPIEPVDMYYLIAKSDMGFGINAGDYVFVITHDSKTSSFLINKLYLVRDDQGFEALKCSSGDSERAVFQSANSEHSRILSVRNITGHEKRTPKDAEHFCGEVIAILRSTDLLLTTG